VKPLTHQPIRTGLRKIRVDPPTVGSSVSGLRPRGATPRCRCLQSASTTIQTTRYPRSRTRIARAAALRRVSATGRTRRPSPANRSCSAAVAQSSTGTISQSVWYRIAMSADVCTSAPTLAYSAYQPHLSAGATCVRDSGNSGAVNVTATAPSWLKYLWDASSGVMSNPVGIATFGVFPGPASRVYEREVY